MYITGELVFKNYKPLKLEPGMLFFRILNGGTFKEHIEIYALDRIPLNEEEYIRENGHPIEMYVVDNEYNAQDPLVQPEQIAWFDEGPETEDLHDITIKEINTILNDYGGYVDVEVDEEYPDIVILAEGKAILSYISDYDDDIEDDDVCYNCGSDDLYYNSSGDISCNNCGWEENEELI